jgi:hypothetical protein
MTGRSPIDNRAMSAAERQRRRRKSLAKDQSSAATKASRAKARQKAAAYYIPTPPDVTLLGEKRSPGCRWHNEDYLGGQ